MTDSSRTSAMASDSPGAGRSVSRERVRAMESLAGIIAHEIRSSVLGVTSAAQLLRYAVPQDPVTEKSLGRILQESERLSSLHEALSEYATEVPPRLTDGDPDLLLTQVIRNMRGALEASAVVLSHEPAEAIVGMDETQLSRAFERLIHHAIGRGRVGCELRLVSEAEDHNWRLAISIS